MNYELNLEQLQKKLQKDKYSFIADIQGELYTSKLIGIAPVINQLKKNPMYFKGAVVLDKVVGKAVAMLLVKSQVAYIYAHILSKKAQEILEKYQIAYKFDILAEFIENRSHTGMCPMEETVYDIDDLEIAFIKLIEKQKELAVSH